MFHIIGQLLFGFVVGVIAKFLMPGRDPGGCIVTALLGIGGAALFGWLSRQFLNSYGSVEGVGWIGAIVGTVLLLLVYRLIFGEAKS